MDILYIGADGKVDVVVTDDNGAAVSGAQVTGTMYDALRNVVPELSGATATEVAGSPGTYRFAVAESFNPPDGVCEIQIVASESSRTIPGTKYVRAKKLILS